MGLRFYFGAGHKCVGFERKIIWPKFESDVTSTFLLVVPVVNIIPECSVNSQKGFCILHWEWDCWYSTNRLKLNDLQNCAFLSKSNRKTHTTAKIIFGGIYWNQTIYAKWSQLLQLRASSKAFFHDPCWTSSDWYFWDDMKTNITVLAISLQFFVFQKLNSAWGLKKIRQNSAGEKYKKAAKLMTVIHFDITCCGVAQLIWN